MHRVSFDDLPSKTEDLRLVTISYSRCSTKRVWNQTTNNASCEHASKTAKKSCSVSEKTQAALLRDSTLAAPMQIVSEALSLCLDDGAASL